MKNTVEKYKERFGWVPQIGIVFCGNRAVLSIRREGFSPEFHQDVYYGLFFWTRVAFTAAKSFRRIKNRAKNG